MTTSSAAVRVKLSEAIQTALEEELHYRKKIDAELSLFRAVQPLREGATPRRTAKKMGEEQNLRVQISQIKAEHKIRKQLDADAAKTVDEESNVINMFFPADSSSAGVVSETVENEDSDDEFDVDANAPSTSWTSGSTADAPSSLRRDLIAAGVRPRALQLDWMAVLPQALDLARLKNQLLATPYKGESCLLFALQPPQSTGSPWKKDCSAAVKTIQALANAGGGGPSLSSFVGAIDYRDHVLIALRCPGRTSLARMASALTRGDCRISARQQIALALDMGNALKALHEKKITHGAFASENVVLSLRPIVQAHVIFTGIKAPQAGPNADIFMLGLCFTILALRRPVTLNALPDVFELRAAAHEPAEADPPFLDFVELSAQIILNRSAALRPTIKDILERLQTISADNKLNDDANLRRFDASSGALAVGHLDVAAFPLRPYF